MGLWFIFIYMTNFFFFLHRLYRRPTVETISTRKPYCFDNQQCASWHHAKILLITSVHKNWDTEKCNAELVDWVLDSLWYDDVVSTTQRTPRGLLKTSWAERNYTTCAIDAIVMKHSSRFMSVAPLLEFSLCFSSTCKCKNFIPNRKG